jgi:outer membrane protein OmpA-like peptidoglycan-associated protein
MSLNILETFSSVVGGPVIRQLSSGIGESEDATRAAIHSSGPLLVASMMEQVTSTSGATEVYRAINDDRLDDNLVAKLSSVLSNRGSFEAFAKVGESMSRSLLGNRGGALVSALSSVSGVNPSSAQRLLSIALPVIFDIIRKYTKQHNLGISSVVSVLLNQRTSLEQAGLDGRITQAMGFSDLSSLLDSLPAKIDSVRQNPGAASTRVMEPEPRKSWLPWAIAAGLAGLALLFWSGNRSDRRSTLIESAAVPGFETNDPSESASVYFDRDEVALSDDDRQKIIRVAEAARPETRPVAITGYTDRTRNETQSLEVAKDRAAAVREALVAEGVAESQIVMDPPEIVTDAGRDSEARRVDIQVR